MTFESKFAINDPVQFHDANHRIRYSGTVESITFTTDTVYYAIRTVTGLTHSVPESVIERKE